MWQKAQDGMLDLLSLLILYSTACNDGTLSVRKHISGWQAIKS